MGLLSMAMAKAKAKATATTTHTTDMGLLLVFFPQNHNAPNTNTSFKRTNSNNLILSKTQSTISICALLFFLTLLLFTLSTFEPTNTLHRNNNNSNHHPTKLVQSKTQNHNNWFLPKRFWPNTPFKSQHSHSPSKALQRMGTLYRRGTRAMTDLVICHVADETTVHEFRYFLRLIHRSGLTARSDVVFLFSSRSLSSSFAPVIREENEAFSSLVELHSELNSTRWSQLKHGKKNNDASRTSQRQVNPAVVMGGARGVRRLANAVVVEIVRAAMQQRKRKNSVSESAILSQLTGGNEIMLKGKGVELMEPSESIPDASQLSGRNSGASLSDYAIIQRGTTSNHDLINSVIKKQICSSVVDSSVYRDC
ncbi:uncharacterized protein LOC107645489 [Arachis ipaensis]|uniref:uncharacterized protein LOC107645489 n=1 Tax=Arachis ipaensis TaxID=130454 RepID=UPI0007AF72EA|nr:uncharacterized protein LOC107645489 [Arachis ipaensis]